ncbi:MAG TPA: AMP-binding protein [Salinivirga sp.]|uniref:AMP-binding protein n=1 Tax=Salinivirga sp. TaxID=1970192 RepID=UPI002B495066|nr:AMP-binding protein [Salinivirga sp.]HKK60232.1 AMP-binding protein [Salinivirga sp.]
MINIQDINKPAIIGAEKTYNYGDLLCNIGYYSQFGQNLQTERVAIFAKNSADWVFAFYGAWNAGFTVVPIDFLASEEDLEYILNDCKPGMIFYDETTREKLEQVESNLSYDIKTVDLLAPKNINGQNLPEWKAPEKNDETAVIIYTSGTTGSPKGVELSFNNLRANIIAVSEKVPIYSGNQQILMLLPLHHIFPLAGSMLIPLYTGATIVESPSMQSADLLKTFGDNKIDLMIGVPKLYKLLYQSISDKVNQKFILRAVFKIVKLIGSKKVAKKVFKKVHDRFGGNLTYLISGGAALDPKVGKFFHSLGFEILEGYGMTEAAPMITFTRPGKFKVSSPGQALPDLEMRIKNDEIIARGPNIMRGYFNRPEETAEVIKDGWLHTGDLGRVDKKGFLHITGRKKEIIVLPSGKNINPVLLEQKLEQHESIAEVAIFFHKSFLHALIVPDMEQFANTDAADINLKFRKEVLPWFNQQVTSYKRVMKFAITAEELPRTRLGKLQRFKLPELFENPVESRITADKQDDSEEFTVIKTFIEQQVDMNVAPDHHIEFDIALDSLDKLSLIDFIDRNFGVKLDEEKLLRFPSISKIAEHVRENKIFHKFEMPDWSAIIRERVNIKLPKSWFSQILLFKGLKYIFKVLFRMRSNGKENIPDGPAIIAPNHQSYLDAVFISAFIKNRELRRTFFYAKRKHIKTKFMNFLAGKHNVIVVDLDQGIKESIQKLAEALKQDNKVVIFPEGTRTKNGEVGDFKKTFAILSKELNVPVVPVAIKGAYNALPTGKKLPRLFTRIQVTYMPPVYPEKHDFDTLTDTVKENIREVVCH